MGREPAESGGEAGENKDALSEDEAFEEKGFASVKEERREAEGLGRARFDEFDSAGPFDFFVLESVDDEKNDGRNEVGLEETGWLSSLEGVGGRDLSFRIGL